jgi:hypothetical protein
LTHAEVLGHPVRLTLASMVVGLSERSLPPEAALRFKMALGERFGIDTEACARLLNVSYGLVLGLWQLKGCMGSERYQHLLDPGIARAFVTEYPAETLDALRSLWSSAIDRAKPQRSPS